MVFEQLPPLLVLNHIIFFIQLNLHLCYYREGKVPKKVPNSNTNLEPYRFKREPDPTLLTTQRPQWYSHFTALHVLSKPQSNDSFLLQVTLNTQRSSLHRDHNLILTLSTSDTRAETTVSEKISVDLLEMKCTPKKKTPHKRSSEVLRSYNRASDGCGPHGDEFGWCEHDLSHKRRLRTGFSSSIPKIRSVL